MLDICMGQKYQNFKALKKIARKCEGRIGGGNNSQGFRAQCILARICAPN